MSEECSLSSNDPLGFGRCSSMPAAPRRPRPQLQRPLESCFCCVNGLLHISPNSRHQCTTCQVSLFLVLFLYHHHPSQAEEWGGSRTRTGIRVKRAQGFRSNSQTPAAVGECRGESVVSAFPRFLEPQKRNVRLAQPWQQKRPPPDSRLSWRFRKKKKITPPPPPAAKQPAHTNNTRPSTYARTVNTCSLRTLPQAQTPSEH